VGGRDKNGSEEKEEIEEIRQNLLRLSVSTWAL
jgi:hypothetical protein